MRYRALCNQSADLLGDAHRAVDVCFRQQHAEFFAANSRCNVTRTMNHCGKDTSNRLEHAIACRMAITIVIALEIVHVDNQQAQGLLRPART